MIQKETVREDPSEILSPCLSEALSEWETSIRAACDTLVRMPTGMMDSIMVTGAPRCSEEEGRLLERISQEAADKRGLKVEVTVTPGAFTVRFRR